MVGDAHLEALDQPAVQVGEVATVIARAGVRSWWGVQLQRAIAARRRHRGAAVRQSRLLTRDRHAQRRQGTQGGRDHRSHMGGPVLADAVLLDRRRGKPAKIMRQESASRRGAEAQSSRGGGSAAVQADAA